MPTNPIINEIMRDFENYRHIFLSLTSEQYRTFTADLDKRRKTSIDATSESFQEVFPIDILGQGEHFVAIRYSAQPIPDERKVYQNLVTGTHRQLLFTMAPPSVDGIDEMLPEFMTPEEARDYKRYRDRLPNPLICKPHSKSHGLHVVIGKEPLRC